MRGYWVWKAECPLPIGENGEHEMSKGRLYIGAQWLDGAGASFSSTNPATGDQLWTGKSANAAQVTEAVAAARAGFEVWGMTGLDDRVAVLRRFAALVDDNRATLGKLISAETGKALWDAMGEPTAMVAKLDISLKAYEERTGSRLNDGGAVRARLSHKPHGVMAVFGPFNFPAHLPNGHILPALLAGNSIVFKPSEQTPAVGEFVVDLWRQAGLPDGVMNLVQGEGETGRALVAQGGIDGILFTGSVPTGRAIAKAVADRPHLVLALELGGNNPLIYWGADDVDAAAMVTVQSAFVSAGQRCTCARRLIVPTGTVGDHFITALKSAMGRLRVGAPDSDPAVFMGSMISARAADGVIAKQDALLALGGEVIVPAIKSGPSDAFVSPGLIDVSGVASLPDEECFGPLLQVTRVADFAAAITAANDTSFGLAAGLLSDDEALYENFYRRIRAGIVNWNQPLTGASSAAPFGGVGASGNNRPSAYYAADYCAFPVASLENGAGRVEMAATPVGIDEV